VIFIFRHITRQRAKTLLVTSIALFFVLALGYLQTAIESTESEIGNLYSNTIVTGEIRQANFRENAPGRLHNNVIRKQTIKEVNALVINTLIQSCHEFAVLTPASEDGSLPENWDILAGININANLSDNLSAFDTLVGINDLERFARLNSRGAGDNFSSFSWTPNEEVSWIRDWQTYADFAQMYINFDRGFDPKDFVFAEGSPIPIIINNQIMGSRGFEFGDIVYLSASTILYSWIWDHTPAVIVGVHNRIALPNQIIRSTLMPGEALEHIVGDELRYFSMRFEIDPVYNHEITRVQNEITEITEHISAGEVSLRLFLDDEELRMVVIPMEQNLSLLRLLYPVAIVLSIIIGLGLSMLLMLQYAKVAAIKRVLGTSRKKVRTTLCAEQMLICMIGLVLGLVIITILGWGFGFASSLGLAGLYLAGAVAGMIIGAVVITNRPPLELLQVKE
jgi:hypothetical protein